MKTKAEKMLILLSCFIFVVALSSMNTKVAAEENEFTGDLNISSAGDDNPPADFMIDGKTIIRKFHNEEVFQSYNPAQGHPLATAINDYLSIGDNAGLFHNTDFGTCFSLPHSDARDVCYDYEISQRNTFIGQSAGRDFTRGKGNLIIGANAGALGGVDDPVSGWTARQNVIIGSSANGAAKFEAYNTIVGGVAGLLNEGTMNTFLGCESGRLNTTGFANIFIGQNAGAGHYVDGIWRGFETGDYNISIGFQTEAASPDISNSIALGNHTLVEGNNQMVVGSYYPEHNNIEGLITSSYWGSGVSSTDPQNFTFNASGGKGDNVFGADLIIAGGKSTGDADGGSIIFQTSPAGSTCSGGVPCPQNDPVERVIITSDGKLDVKGTTLISTTNTKLGLGVNTSLDQDGVVAADLIRGAVYNAKLSGAATGHVYGMVATSVLENTAATAGSLVGAAFTSQIGRTSTAGTTNANEVIGFQYTLNRHWNNQRTYNIANSYGIHSRIGEGSSSATPVNVTNHYHHFIDDPGLLTKLNITNLAGMWIDQQIAGTNNYGIVLDGDGIGADIVFGPNQDSSIYSNSGELFAEDAAGNVTQISPHDPKTGEWIFYSKNVKTGRTVRVNMEELVKDMEKLTGKKYLIESFTKEN